MVRMVMVKRQSVAFCKYVIAGLLWLALIIQNVVPIWLVLIIMVSSAILGVHHSPLVFFFDKTFAKLIKTKEEYINMHSMRFAHMVGAGFSIVSLILFYLNLHIFAWVVVTLLAVMQSIASFGYCSAQKLYECVICNNNCCNLGKRIKKKHVR